MKSLPSSSNASAVASSPRARPHRYRGTPGPTPQIADQASPCTARGLQAALADKEAAEAALFKAVGYQDRMRTNLQTADIGLGSINSLLWIDIFNLVQLILSIVSILQACTCTRMCARTHRNHILPRPLKISS